MTNVIQRKDLGEIHPAERVKFWFDLKGYSAFDPSNPDGAETLTAGPSWKCVTTADTSTDLGGTIVQSTDYDDATKRVAVEVASMTDGNTYYLIGLLTVSSSRKYIVVGKVKCTDHGINVTF